MRAARYTNWNGLLAAIVQACANKAVVLFLVLATLAVYWQVLGFDFINFDDPDYVTENRFVSQGLTLEGIRWAFTAFHSSNWHPLTWLSHMLDVQLFGLNAGWHHLTSVLIHVLNSLLLFVLLNMATGSKWRSAFVAALFSLHPLHAESVVWISERKDVLSTFFWMLTMVLYFRYVQQPSTRKYLLVLASMACGLMSKPMLVTLPFVLLLFDFWPLSRFGKDREKADNDIALLVRGAWPLVREKLPMFALSLLSSVVTIHAQKSGGAVISLDALDVSTRIGNAIWAYLVYIQKMFWPVDMAILYPHPKALPLIVILVAGLLLAVIFVTVFRLRKSYPYLLTGWLWYVGTLVPVIGLVQVGNQALADRYTYIPLIGLFIMIAWGGSDLLSNRRGNRFWKGISLAAVLPGMMALSWVQIGYWKNEIALYEHALEVTAENPILRNNLGNAYAGRGEFEKAIWHYERAVAMNPGVAAYHNNLGEALYTVGKADRAVHHYQEALGIDPDFKFAHNNLGNLLTGQNEAGQAVVHYLRAVEIDPGFVVAHNNLGLALEKLGKTEFAIRHYKAAIHGDPKFAEAYQNMGVTLFRDGQLELAIEYLQKAVQIKPDYALARENLVKAQAVRLRKSQPDQ